MLLMAVAVGGVLRAQPLPAAPVQGETKQTAAGKSFVWVGVGEWAADEKSAIQSALAEAHSQILAHLNKQQPEMAWRPDIDYVREHCLRDLQEGDVKGEPKEQTVSIPVHGHKAQLERRKTNDKQIEVAHRVRLKVVVNEDTRREMLAKEQDYRGEQRQHVAKARQMWLGKVLIGVFVLLGVMACYIRLDEATKGFYTGWLRLGLAGAAAAIGVTLWLVC
jgi:hypothetical protein